MNLTNILAPKEAVKITTFSEKSPIVQLADSPEAKKWISALKDELTNNPDPRAPYRAPEHPTSCYLRSIETLILRLESKKPFLLWEVCDYLKEDLSAFDCDSFRAACTHMFG